MLTIKYFESGTPVVRIIEEYIGKENSPQEIREKVNKEWKEILRDQNKTNIQFILDVPGKQPTVQIITPADRPMTWGVWGKFNTKTTNGKEPKLYPFECEKQLKKDQKFLAMPGGIPAVAIVDRCVWTERVKFVNAAKGHSLFKIKQLVNDV